MNILDILQAIPFIAIAIIILLFMILIHELGHYIAAKILGFKVKEFAIGFGKVLYRRENKKTGEVFTLRLIPLGGFCSFEGDDDLESKIVGKGDKGDKDDKVNECSRKYEDVINSTKVESFDDVPTKPTKEKRSKNLLAYDKQPPWKRLIVLFAGGFFNFVCAILFAIVLLSIFGYNQLIGVTATSAHTDLEVGDTIYSMAIVSNTFDMNTDNPAGLNFEGFRLLNSIGSMMGGIDPAEQKIIFQVRDVNGQMTFRWAELVWVAEREAFLLPFGGVTEKKPIGFFETVAMSVVFCFEMAWIMLDFLWGLITGQVSLDGIGGPITTVSVMTQVISTDLIFILILIPMISVNLALFNLLPIPALDGARMVFTAIEWIRGKPINPEIEMRIHMVGLILLFGFIIFVDLNFLLGGGGGLNFALFERLLL